MYVYDERNNRWIPLRRTRAYREKRRRMRDPWIVAGLVMIFLPPGAVMSLALFMTFLTFTFLDESVYHFDSGPEGP